VPELVVVIAVVAVAILTALSFIHPRDYAVQERNTQRQLHLAYISQAISRYYADTGKLPADITATPAVIGSESNNVDLCAQLVPKYMRDVPVDPQNGILLNKSCQATKDQPSAYDTRYTIAQEKDGTIVLNAIAAEAGQKIEIRHKY